MPASHEFLDRVARKHGDSFYVFNAERFKSNYLAFREGLRRHYRNSDVAYAFKANYMPAIGRLLADLQGMGEVVSRFEYDVARRFLPADRLVFNGPVKRDEDLLFALQSGSQLNLDSLHELERLVRLTDHGAPCRIGLRISACKADGAESRFGLSAETGELDAALKLLDQHEHITVNSLHCHLNSPTKTPEEFVARLETLWSIANTLNPRHRLGSINVGGGFFGRLPEALRRQFDCPIATADEYTAAIGKAFASMCPDGQVQLLIEPGVSVVADTMILVARVMGIRQRNGRRQALLDTSIVGVNPTHSALQAPLSVVAPERARGSLLQPCALVGNTCMEHDTIVPELVADLEVGDFIVFGNRGAYSINYTPDFIHPASAIVDSHGNLLKSADNATTALASYVTDDPGGQVQ